MAAGTEISPVFTDVEGGYNSKDDGEVSVVKDKISENVDDLKQLLNCKPPRHLSIVRHSIITAVLVSPTDLIDLDLWGTGIKSPSDIESSFQPVFRSGSCAEKGPKQCMEDKHICIDNLPQHLGEISGFSSPGAFKGVFDGHGGTDAASFVKNNILKFIVEDSFFPICLEKVMKSAFLKADYALLMLVPLTYHLAPQR